MGDGNASDDGDGGVASATVTARPDDAIGRVTHGNDDVGWLFAPGQQLAGRYRVTRFLARGGMGEVYEVFDDVLGAAIAIKALMPAGGDPIKREARLRREVHLGRQVTHPAVCRLFDVDHETTAAPSGTMTVPFVTMELLSGSTLGEHLTRNGPLAPEAAMPIVEQLVLGLEAAHEVGIIHRDFKPANVILVPRDGQEPRVVITDFGLARALTDDEVVTTTDFAGTPAYMAPEQVLNQPMTAATDVFALGVTLFELVTGARPYEGTSPFGVAMQRVRADAPRAITRTPGLDPRWDAVIARCLARDPADRFARVRDVLEGLRGTIAVRPARQKRWWLVAATGMTAAAGVTALWINAARERSSTETIDDAAQSLDPIGERPAFERPATGPFATVLTVSADWSMINAAESTADGDLVVVGHVRGRFAIADGAWPRGAGARTGFVARLSPAGHVRWMRRIEATAESWVATVALAGDRVVIGGAYFGELSLDTHRLTPSGPDADGFVAVLDGSTGAAYWTAGCDCAQGHVRDVVADGAGNVYATGEFRGPATFGTDKRHDTEAVGRGPFVIAYDARGRVRWVTAATRIPGSARPKGMYLRGNRLVVAAHADGPFELGGRAIASSEPGDVVLGALDAESGAIAWIRPYTGQGVESVVAIEPLPDGRFAIAGSFQRELTIETDRPVRSVGATDSYVAIVDEATGDIQRVWTGGSPGWDELKGLAWTGRELVAVGRAQDGFAMGSVKRTPGTGSVLAVAIDLERGPTRMWALGGSTEDVARTAVATSRGTVLITGRARYKLALEGRSIALAGSTAGFLVELRAR